MRTRRSTPTSFDLTGRDCSAWFLPQACIIKSIDLHLIRRLGAFDNLFLPLSSSRLLVWVRSRISQELFLPRITPLRASTNHCANSLSRLLFLVWLFVTARVSTLNKMVWLVSKLALGYVADA